MLELDQQVQTLPLEKIKIGLTIENMRQTFNQDTIKELADSIYANGLLQPIVVMEVEDEEDEDVTHIELVCGARRKAAIELILKDIDEDWTCDTDPGDVFVVMFSGDIEDAELLNGIENIEREDVDDVDTSAWLHRMSREAGHTQQDLAKRLNKSPQWVSSRVLFHERAGDELKKALREGLVRFSTACVLAEKLSVEEQNKRVKKARDNDEKLIKLEDAKVEGDTDRVAKPSGKKRSSMRELAESYASQEGYTNATGVAMALRWVEGLQTEEELEEVIKCITTISKDRIADTAPATGEE